MASTNGTLQNLKLQLVRAGLGGVGKIFPGIAAGYALKMFSSPRRYARQSWEEELLKTATVLKFTSRHVSQLSAHKWGPDGVPKILLVHGWAGRGTQLGAVVPPLVKAGFQVICFDGPAHGESPGERTNVQFFANVLVILGRELGPLHGAIGHSFGATALSLAVDRGLIVDRVVSIASPTDLQRVVSTFSGYLRLKKPVAKALLRQLEKWAGVKMVDLNLRDVAARATVPALIVHDPEDKEVSFKNAEIMVGSWRNSKLLKIPKAGHRRILRSPKLVDAVTKFMSADLGPKPKRGATASVGGASKSSFKN